MCRSVPQIPVHSTRIFTSLIPGDGSGTFSSHNPSAAWLFTKAFILDVLWRSPPDVQNHEDVSLFALRTLHARSGRNFALIRSPATRRAGGRFRFAIGFLHLGDSVS